MRIISRTEWGARAARGRDTIASTRGVKVHYMGAAVNRALLDDHGRCDDLVRSVQNGHMVGNGWTDIAYNLAVCPHGFVFMGRGAHVLTAANGPGLNTDHYAVLALLGSSGLVKPTPNMLTGLSDAISWLRQHGDAGLDIAGHRDGYNTSCPGAELYRWVRAGAPRPDGKPLWPCRYLQLKTPFMKGADVRQVQDWLNIAMDGVFGPKTAAAVKRAQQKRSLTADGIVGPVSWRAFGGA